MQATGAQSNNSFHGTQQGPQNNWSGPEQANNYNQAQSSRQNGEDLAGYQNVNNSMKKPFTFTQKAGMWGLGITAVFAFVMKSKVFSFLVGLPTAVLCYLGFKNSFSGKVADSQQAQQQTSAPQQEQKFEPLSPESLDKISAINQLAQNEKDPLKKDFLLQVMKAISVTDSFAAEILVPEIKEESGLSLNARDYRQLISEYHPDKAGQDKSKQELFQTLAKVINELKV